MKLKLILILALLALSGCATGEKNPCGQDAYTAYAEEYQLQRQGSDADTADDWATSEVEDTYNCQLSDQRRGVYEIEKVISDGEGKALEQEFLKSTAKKKKRKPSSLELVEINTSSKLSHKNRTKKMKLKRKV